MLAAVVAVVAVAAMMQKHVVEGSSAQQPPPRPPSPSATETEAPRELQNTLADAQRIVAQPGATVLILGDSTGNDSFEWVALWAEAWTASRAVTLHTWDDLESEWRSPAQLSSSGTALTIWNMSAPGKPSRHASEIVAEQREAPDLVIYNFGHNDTDQSIYLGLAAAKAATEERWGVRSLPGVVMLQNPSLAGFRLRQQQTMESLREVGAPELGLPVVDAWSAFPKKPAALRRLLFDDVHPNEDGSRVWADVVIEELGPN